MYGKIYMTIRSVFSSDRPPMSQIVENVRYLNVEEFFKKKILDADPHAEDFQNVNRSTEKQTSLTNAG